MVIKSILFAMGITITTLSAAKVLGEDAVEPNADLNLLISAYCASANSQTMMNLRLYINSLQAEIDYLVNLGEITEATAKVESASALLDPIIEGMSDEHRESIGSKSLNLLKDFIKKHMPSV